MKKVFAVLMCITLLLTTLLSLSSIPASAALEDDEASEEMDVLSQLGVLNAKASAASVTKSVMAEGLNKIFNSDGYADKYFEGQDMSMPLLGGQAAMIFVDVLGYSPEVKVKGGEDPDAYIRKARQIKIVPDGGLKAADELTIGQYAEMMYRALVETPIMRQETYGTFASYKVDKGATLLSDRMNIKVIRGIVQSVGKFNLKSTAEEEPGYMTVSGISYRIDETHNRYEYLGRLAEVYVDDDENKVRACIVSADNKILKLTSEDISDSTMSSVKYYLENKERNAKLSAAVDIVYNRELMTSYTAADFKRADCNYTFIDNNSDGTYEVVMIEHYTSAVINQISYSDKIVSLTGGGMVELDEYFENGYKMYDQKGLELNADMIARSQVLSYMVGASGKITNIIICSHKETGTVDGFRDNKDYVTINGTEYKCTKEYVSNAKKKEVNLGDYVTASLDFLGYVVDIDVGKTGGRTAYFIGIADAGFGECSIKLLDEDGEIKVLKTSEKITLNDGRVSSSTLLADKRLTAEGEAKRQLIKYRKNSQNQISAIELAEYRAYVGSRANEGFTLDYDFEKDGILRALSVNGRKLLGAKYVCNEDTVVYHYCTSDEKLSYVQNGSSIGTNSNLNLKLYNINNDYDIQYAVREFKRSFGGWTDYYGDTYMVDYVAQVWNEDSNEMEYELNLYDPKGNKKALRTTDGTIVPSIYNIFSGDNRLAEIQIKDLKRGSVIQVGSDWRGVTSYSLQHMPMTDNSEFIFEKITGSGDNYGITKTMFNGSYLMCYGLVVTRAKYGVIINNHIPTAEEGAEFPMEEWNRYIPLEATDKVIVYDKERDTVTPDVAACIREGDHIFIKRSGTAYNGVYIFR